ncbi:MAG: GTP 3',8-cyclase MoaA [Nitrospirae bacterium]|nr:GTP 3',8-cyclase MoaA [Nitrospirota bacterium]
MLRDRYGRKIDYLRISVTDRCNLRCVYCMPESGVIPKNPRELLSFEEIEEVARAAISLGINKIRITGGEPLVRRDLVSLIGNLSKIKLLSDLSITTNGTFLEDYARDLKEAGLHRVNVSLDTLNEEKYEFITGSDGLRKALQGVEKALQIGLSPVKVNMVVMKGINDDEIIDFVKLSYDKPVSVRFIEFMPFGRNLFWEEKRFIPISEVKAHCRSFAELLPADGLPGSGPARYYRIKGGRGTMGFISPLSSPFCSRCNRLRLTSEGKLRPCLYSEKQIDLRKILRENASGEEIGSLIKLSVSNKPKEHYCGAVKVNRAMSQIGG